MKSALSEAGYPGLEVAISGQRASLRGIVGAQADIGAARDAALGAAGAGGAWAGGVASVDVSGVGVGPIERPFLWSVRRGDNRVVLAGAVPSEAARQELLANAAAAFPNAERVDRMRVVGGAPAANWTAMAGHVMRALNRLDEGEARMHDARIALIGDGRYDDVNLLRADYAAPPAPFRALLAVSVDGLDLAHPQLQGLDLRRPGAGVCTQAFARLTDGGAIAFAPDSASLEPASQGAVEALASVALRCDAHQLLVRGPAEGGAALSRSRAETIVNALAATGVMRTRLRALPGAGRWLVIAADEEAGP